MKRRQFITVFSCGLAGLVLEGVLVFGVVFDTATAETNQPPTNQVVQPMSDGSPTHPKATSRANARSLATPGNPATISSTGSLGPISNTPHIESPSRGTMGDVTPPAHGASTSGVTASVKPTTVSSARALGPISELPQQKLENSGTTRNIAGANTEIPAASGNVTTSSSALALAPKPTKPSAPSERSESTGGMMATSSAASTEAAAASEVSTTNPSAFVHGLNPEMPNMKSESHETTISTTPAASANAGTPSGDSATNLSAGTLESTSVSHHPVDSSSSAPVPSGIQAIPPDSFSQKSITQPSQSAQLPSTSLLNPGTTTRSRTETIKPSDSLGYPLDSASSPVPSRAPIGPIVASVPSASISGNESSSPSPQIVSESVSPPRTVSQDPSPSISIGSPAAPTSIILFSLPFFALFLLAYVGLRCS
jgi:hypothetical protein